MEAKLTQSRKSAVRSLPGSRQPTPDVTDPGDAPGDGDSDDADADGGDGDGGGVATAAELEADDPSHARRRSSVTAFMHAQAEVRSSTRDAPKWLDGEGD